MKPSSFLSSLMNGTRMTNFGVTTPSILPPAPPTPAELAAQSRAELAATKSRNEAAIKAQRLRAVEADKAAIERRRAAAKREAEIDRKRREGRQAEVVVVGTAAAARQAREEIEAGGYQVLGVDCEAAGMKRSGELCLVQVAVTDETRLPVAEKVYLFDVCAGGMALFDAGLREILANPRTVKVIHDCRLDSDILFHNFRASMANVFDTQVAYAVLAIGHPSSTRFPLPAALNTVLASYAPGRANKFKDEARAAMGSDEGYWRSRPLTDLMIGYASEDVCFLPFVWRQMTTLMTAHQKQAVREYSEQYNAQCRDSPAETDRQAETGPPRYNIDLLDTLSRAGMSISEDGKRVFRVPRAEKERILRIAAYDYNSTMQLEAAEDDPEPPTKKQKKEE
jgi:hypothetical protein